MRDLRGFGNSKTFPDPAVLRTGPGEPVRNDRRAEHGGRVKEQAQAGDYEPTQSDEKSESGDGSGSSNELGPEDERMSQLRRGGGLMEGLSDY